MYKIVYIICIILCSCNSQEQKQTLSQRIIYPQAVLPSSQKSKTFQKTEYTNYLDWFKTYATYLSQETIIDSMVYGILMQPVDLLVSKENNFEDYDSYLKMRSEYEGMEYYLFSFGYIDGADVLKKGDLAKINKKELMQYVDFTIQQDFALQDCYGIREPSLYHLERHGGIRPYYTAILAFKRYSQIDTCEKTIIYYDKLFNSGIVKLTI